MAKISTSALSAFPQPLPRRRLRRRVPDYSYLFDEKLRIERLERAAMSAVLRIERRELVHGTVIPQDMRDNNRSPSIAVLRSRWPRTERQARAYGAYRVR